MQEKREMINKQIRYNLEFAIEEYKLLSKDIENLEKALTLNNAQELSLALDKIFDHTFGPVFHLDRIRELVGKKRVGPKKREYANMIINKVNTRFATIYLNSENIEKNLKQNNREPINGLLEEIKQDYKDLGEYLNKAHELIEL